MSSNKNLFYKLYSITNNVVNAGYTCSSAINEEDTSFDITTSVSGGSAGTITDSNGNTLASIDLNDIHAGGISQYNTETRILQPHSCCVLQGQEFGLACASYYYVIPKQIEDVDNYEYYINCDFDVIYDNFSPFKFHVHTVADGKTSFIKQINKIFKDNNIEVAVSVQKEEDELDKHTYEYLVFLSQKEGYFYYINNLRVTINFQSEDYPNSPFTNGIDKVKTYIYDLIDEFHPMKEVYNPETGEYYTPEYDKDTYEVDCELYTWLLHNYMDAVKDINSFGEMIEYIQLALDAETEEDAELYLEEANVVIKNTVYDADFFNNYDLDNMRIIYALIDVVKHRVDELNEFFQTIYWLREDRHKRIPLMKYPNGAFRGIVLVPDWPSKNDDFEYASLWINHIKSKVRLFVPTKDHHFVPKMVGVLSNATLVNEEEYYRKHNHEFGSVSIENSISCIPAGWDEHDNISSGYMPNNTPDNIDTDYMDPYRPDKQIDDDLAWMGQNYYSKKKDIIGLFRYMQYVNDNDLWNKVGEAYMIIGKDDDPQSQNLNLPTSLLVYNPNNEPIRIKYMIFS